MALIGLDKEETFEYISRFDKDKNNPTIFLLGVLSGKDKLKFIEDAFTADGNLDIKKLQSKSYDIVKTGLKGIKNLYNKKTGKYEHIIEITEEILDKLPTIVVTELAGKIIEINYLTEEEEKN